MQWLKRRLRQRNQDSRSTDAPEPQPFRALSGSFEPGQVEIGDPHRCGVVSPTQFSAQHPASVLLITLDSCRYDVFASAKLPKLKSIGSLYRAMAPAHYTYPSHASIFAGFTPGCAELAEPYVNPKYAKIFKLIGPGIPGKGREFAMLPGRNIVDGFRRLGYRTIGAGGVGWFRPDTHSGRVLSADFDRFFWGGRTWALPAQLEFVHRELAEFSGRSFVFLNVGETHVPYYHEGCGWDLTRNPGAAFGGDNDAEECRRRQSACLEYADRLLGPLIEAFSNSTIIACADHGDCWGEDGLWEHSIFHPKVFEVPLVFRLGERPAAENPQILAT